MYEMTSPFSSRMGGQVTKWLSTAAEPPNQAHCVSPPCTATYVAMEPDQMPVRTVKPVNVPRAGAVKLPL